jgi:hypothetical protein
MIGAIILLLSTHCSTSEITISHLIWLALTLAILPAISLADGLPNQILWNKDETKMDLILAGSFEMEDHFNQEVQMNGRCTP